MAASNAAKDEYSQNDARRAERARQAAITIYDSLPARIEPSAQINSGFMPYTRQQASTSRPPLHSATSYGATSGNAGLQAPPVAIHENRSACCGIMSPVRRTFCLLAPFDFILIFIIWVIYTKVIGEDLLQSFIIQVVHYDFQTSLFDLVLCSAWRCIPLLLAYALFRISNPWVVAVTTFGTCVFVVAKVASFNWSQETNVVVYFLFLTTFTIAWVEAWFLDFKVLPREAKAREQGDLRGVAVADERAPLLRHPEGDEERYHSLPESDEEGPISSMHSLEANSSQFRSLPASQGRSRQSSISSLQASLGEGEKEYVTRAEETWEIAWDILHSVDWTKENCKSEGDLNEGYVSVKSFPEYGNVFKLEAYIDCSPEDLFEEIVMNVENSSEWNPNILESRIVKILNDSTDICYSVSSEAAGGLVSSRDFVNLRHWATRNGVLLSCVCAVNHTNAPPSRNYVRAENGPGCWAFRPVPGNLRKCHFTWILNTDIKGWVPQYAIDQALSKMMVDFLDCLKRRMSSISDGPFRR